MATEYKTSSFKFTIDTDNHDVEAEYIGPTGPGSVAYTDFQEVMDALQLPLYFHSKFRKTILSALNGQDIEKVVTSIDSINNMPILKSFETTNKVLCCLIDCPKIESVVVCEGIDEPVEIRGDHGHVTIQYLKGIIGKDDAIVSDDNLHVIFGDEVEKVQAIKGGHVTLGKGVKSIYALKKADMGLKADSMVAEYELPTRIDFATAEPPIIGSVAPGSMTVAELHVPAGALDAYTSHPQWGKAAYFVDADGKTVDHYAAKHKARMKKLGVKAVKEDAEAIEQAKTDKLKGIGAIMHSTLGPQKLAKWQGKLKQEWQGSFDFEVMVSGLTLEISLPKDSAPDIWDKITAKLESLEAQLKRP